MRVLCKTTVQNSQRERDHSSTVTQLSGFAFRPRFYTQQVFVAHKKKWGRTSWSTVIYNVVTSLSKCMQIIYTTWAHWDLISAFDEASMQFYLASTSLRSLLWIVMAHVSWHLYLNASYRKCSVVPGVLLCKFTTLKKPYIWSWYVFQTSKCIHLQMMNYGKSVLMSLHSIMQGNAPN